MSERIVNLDLVVPNQTRYLRLVGTIAEQIAKETDACVDRETLAYHLNLVLTEAMANAIQYGGRRNAKDTVRVSLAIENEDLCVRVYDHGQGFNLAAVPMPDLSDLQERGRGIFFIRSLMDSVEYHKTESGNVLEMHKKLA